MKGIIGTSLCGRVINTKRKPGRVEQEWLDSCRLRETPGTPDAPTSAWLLDQRIMAHLRPLMVHIDFLREDLPKFKVIVENLQLAFSAEDVTVSRATRLVMAAYRTREPVDPNDD